MVIVELEPLQDLPASDESANAVIILPESAPNRGPIQTVD